MTQDSFNIQRYMTLARPYKVAITIPTYKRPEGLHNLLQHLEKQIKEIYLRSDNPLEIVLIVAENDPAKNAGATVVEASRINLPCEVYCISEKRKGVSVVRNTLTRAALNRNCDFILFIDDDEWPSEHWIEKLIETADVFTADIVSAPVVPAYQGTPPQWIIKGRFFEDDKYDTGATPGIKRTSNLLIRSSWLKDSRIFTQGSWFNEALGHYGGEDSMLIETLLRHGAKHVWCREASVCELIPKDRQTIEYLARRAYRFGNIGLLYRSMLRPGIFSGIIRTGKTTYLIVRWAVLSGRYFVGREKRKQHLIEGQTVLGRINAHRGSYQQHY